MKLNSRTVIKSVRSKAGRMPVRNLALICFVLLFAGIGVYRLFDGKAIPPPLSAVPVEPVCGVTDLRTISAPTSTKPSNIISQFAGSFAVHDMKIGGVSSVDTMFIQSGNTVRKFRMSDGAATGSFTTSVDVNRGFSLDDQGNVYFAQNPNTGQNILKYNSSGQLIWNRAGGGIFDGSIFAYVHKTTASDPGQFRIGAVERGKNASRTFNSDGNFVANTSIVGTHFNYNTTTGKLLTTDGNAGYVRIYDQSANRTGMFGTQPVDPNSGGPFHFYQMGMAAMDTAGTVYIPDGGLGMISASEDGIYQGRATDDGQFGYITEAAPAAIYNDRLYFANGGKFSSAQKISSASLADVRAVISTPKQPDPILGFGAGLTSTAIANYFKPSQAPAINITFDPWWGAKSSAFTGQYTVRERKQILVGNPGTTQAFTIPANGGNVPVTLPTAKPGYYQVEARLIKDGQAVAGSCLSYGIGATGATLDMNTLPDGADEGGAKPNRAVQLSSDLGFSLVRVQFRFDEALPSGASSTAPLDFSKFDAEYQAAAQRAAATGVTLVVQLAANTQVDKDLLANGRWQSRVQEVVNHYKSSVKHWEPWNEPNNNGYSGVDYVNKILKPFHDAVRAADSTAKVVGGSVLNMNHFYFDEIGNAGGFNYMDIISVHIYTGHGRSYEEEGLIQRVQEFKAILSKHNASTKPIWDTESGFWNLAVHNTFSQADYVVRKLMFYQQIGVQKWSYFYPEGNFSDPMPYGLIRYSNVSLHTILPGALAAMNHKVQVGNRSLVKFVATQTPHTYAALYGTVSGAANQDQVLVVWSDELKTTVKVSVNALNATSLSLTDLLGDSTSLTVSSDTVSVPVDGSPRYLKIPSTIEPTVAPDSDFGQNLVAASVGGTASASSSNPSEAAGKLIDGTSDAQNNGDPYGQSWTPAWSSQASDSQPWVVVKLPSAKPVGRVIISGHSINSVVSGLRDYDVQVYTGGAWETVASVTNNFWQRRRLVSFAARTTDQVRIVIKSLTYGGLAGSISPWFNNPNVFSPAIIYEVEVFAPGTATPTPPPPPPPTPYIPEDINQDYKVNLTDFGIFRTDFGKCSNLLNPRSNINASPDGCVNLTDFGLFRTKFGLEYGP